VKPEMLTSMWAVLNQEADADDTVVEEVIIDNHLTALGAPVVDLDIGVRNV